MTTPEALRRRVDALEASQARGEAGPATWKDLVLMADGQEYERSVNAPRWEELLETDETDPPPHDSSQGPTAKHNSL